MDDRKVLAVRKHVKDPGWGGKNDGEYCQALAKVEGSTEEVPLFTWFTDEKPNLESRLGEWVGLTVDEAHKKFCKEDADYLRSL